MQGPDGTVTKATMPPSDPRQDALALVAETMGELVTFWGFKGSMGRIWSTLYLSPDPLTADAIAERTRLSAGAVSMGLNDLMQWDLVARDPLSRGRKRRYVAETDIWGIIRRIFRERELRLVGRAIERFGKALERLDEAPDDPEIRFMRERIKGLHALARTGYRLVETFAAVGRLDLLPIRGVLSPGDEGPPGGRAR